MKPPSLLYGYRSSDRLGLQLSFNYLERLYYWQLRSILSCNILPLSMRRYFPISVADTAAETDSNWSLITRLDGVLSHRAVQLSLTHPRRRKLIIFEYPTPHDQADSEHQITGLFSYLADLLKDDDVYLAVHSTNPRPLAGLIEHYPPGWQLTGSVIGRDESDQDQLERLTMVPSLGPGDRSLIAASQSTKQLLMSDQGLRALLNANQFVPLRLVRPLRDFLN